MVKKTHDKSRRGRRGRPTKPETTLLISSLIAKQDAMSRRLVRQISDIERAHLPADECRLVWAAERIRVREIISRRMRAAVLSLAPAADVTVVSTQLEAFARATLIELAGDVQPATTSRPRPAVRLGPSRTLSTARARVASLQAELMDLKARCVRDPAHVRVLLAC